jgi:hypothetical protein
MTAAADADTCMESHIVCVSFVIKMLYSKWKESCCCGLTYRRGSGAYGCMKVVDVYGFCPACHSSSATHEDGRWWRYAMIVRQRSRCGDCKTATVISLCIFDFDSDGITAVTRNPKDKMCWASQQDDKNNKGQVITAICFSLILYSFKFDSKVIAPMYLHLRNHFNRCRNNNADQTKPAQCGFVNWSYLECDPNVIDVAGLDDEKRFQLMR